MDESQNVTELKVIIDDILPYIIVEGDTEVTISGYMGELWNILQEALHFKNQFIRIPFEEGKEMLINGTADVILIPVVVTTTDVHGFDFSVPVAKNWYQLYTKSNANGATSMSYIETWSSSLWIAFLITIFSLTIILWFMLKTRKKFELDAYQKKEMVNKSCTDWKKVMNIESTKMDNAMTTNATSLGSCFLMVLGSVTNQGFYLNTQSTSLRIIMLVILFFGLIMLNSYSAVLVSRLAVDKSDIFFPTLQSVIDRNTHTLCLRHNSYALLLFKDSESDPDFRPMWRSIVNQPPCNNITRVSDVTSVICQDKTVILETPHIIASILETLSCGITRMPGRYATSYNSILMRKRFKFKKKINELLQKLLTSGIIDYLQKKWLFKRMQKVGNISANKPVTMNHIAGVMVLYGLVILASIIVLGADKFNRWRTEKNNTRLEFLR